MQISTAFFRFISLIKTEVIEKDDPALFVLIRHADIRFLSLILTNWDEQEQNLLMLTNNYGETILIFALRSNDFLKVLLIEKTMGPDNFCHLLNMKDNKGRNILRQTIGWLSLETLRGLLQLLEDYNCLQMVQEFYISDDFTDLINNNHSINERAYHDLFNEYRIVNHGVYNRCNLL